MEKYMNIIYGISNFAMVGIIFLVVLAVFIKLTLKKYQVNSSKIKFYGLFLGMDNKSVLAFSLVSVAYIFLVWCIATFQEMNPIYFVIVLVLILLSDILTKNYEKIPDNLFFVGLSSLGIVAINMLYTYSTHEYANIFTMIILGLLILFVFLYFTYYLFKLLNDIVVKQEHLKKKKDYKKL